MHVVPFGRAFRSLIRLLRDGGAVALLADRDYSSRNDKVMFFGKEARLPRGPAMLSMRTNTPILPGFLLREPDQTAGGVPLMDWISSMLDGSEEWVSVQD